MNIASRFFQGLDAASGLIVDDKPPDTKRRMQWRRLLWVVGLVTGIAIGAAAAFGIAGFAPAPAAAQACAAGEGGMFKAV